jgi:beta-glucanase (GH16 family)
MKCACKAFPVLAVLLFLALSPAAHAQVWLQAWGDEFNGAPNSPIDPTKWTYDTGNLNVNNELEIYCSPSMNTQGCDPANPNAFLDGAGHLIIQQRLNGSIWTSARLKTQGLKTFQYGRLEANLQIPSHPGLWPAFWMLGNTIDSIGWPACGEVDIMENWPSLGGTAGGMTHNATSMHGQGYSGGSSLSRTTAFPAGQDVTGFHIYGILWSQNMVQFYFDDPSNITFVRTADDIPAGTSWPFNNSFFLITNMAVGGNLGGTPDGGTAAAVPAMAIDYIRYYQPIGQLAPTFNPANPITVTAGGTGTTALNLTSAAGIGLVYLACSGAPAKSTCSINSNNPLNSHVVDFRTSNSAQVTVNVNTTANTASLAPGFSACAAVLGLGGFVVIPLTPRRRARWAQSARLAVGLTSLLLVAAAFSNCGGGASTSGGGGGSNGTPRGPYTLTITAYTVGGTTSTGSLQLNVN